MADSAAVANDEVVAAQTETPAPGQDVSVNQDASNPADSSIAEKPDAKPESAEPKSVHDVVRDVVSKAKKPKQEEASPSAGEKTDTTPAAAKPEGEATREKDPPFHNHPRWKELQQKHKDTLARVQELEPDAREYASIRTFMGTNGLTTDDAVKLLQVGSLVRNDPPEALKALRAICQQLEDIVGETLPADLADEVEKGLLSEDRARELSKARATAKLAADAATSARTETTRVRQSTAAEANRNDLNKTISEWEAEQKSSDPAFEKKQSLIQDRVGAVLAQQRAKGTTEFSPKQAREILDQAKKYVDTQMSALIPPKAAVRGPIRGSGAAVITPANPGAKVSTFDVVRQSYRPT